MLARARSILLGYLQKYHSSFRFRAPPNWSISKKICRLLMLTYHKLISKKLTPDSQTSKLLERGLQKTYCDCWTSATKVILSRKGQTGFLLFQKITYRAR